jgi:hypothetical protein
VHVDCEASIALGRTGQLLQRLDDDAHPLGPVARDREQLAKVGLRVADGGVQGIRLAAVVSASRRRAGLVEDPELATR